MFNAHPDYRCVNNLDDAKIVCFTGGEDVTPFLYGEFPLLDKSGHSMVHCSSSRDMWEVKLYKSLPFEIAKVGICRGAQFLNVMSGGSMWQDVDGHCGAHMMESGDGGYIQVTSTHHQMMRPGPDATILNSAFKSSIRCAMNVTNTDKRFADPEVVHYWTTNSLCFQPHPEYQDASKALRDLFFERLDSYLYIKGEQIKKDNKKEGKKKK